MLKMYTSSLKTCSESETLAKTKVSQIFFTFESVNLKTYGVKSTVEAFEIATVKDLGNGWSKSIVLENVVIFFLF